MGKTSSGTRDGFWAWIVNSSIREFFSSLPLPFCVLRNMYCYTSDSICFPVTWLHCYTLLCYKTKDFQVIFPFVLWGESPKRNSFLKEIVWSKLVVLKEIRSNWLSPQEPSLTSALTLLWAGGLSRDLRGLFWPLWPRLLSKVDRNGKKYWETEN